MQRRMVILTLLASLAMPGVAVAAPAAQTPAGAVVSLQGTPHIWIADEDGVLHWGGDTRALEGKVIRWDQRTEVSLDQLKTFRRGDPWLSAGLLKSGDPIYLVKWETTDPSPKLLHIQSIADVELFGINGNNYGSFVVERARWEQRFGMSAAGLQRGELASASPSSNAMADRILLLTNEARQKVGAPPLRPSPELATAARTYAAAMAARGCFSHECPPVPELVKRIEGAGYRDWRSAAENIALVPRSWTAEQIVAGWIASSGHYRNMIDPNHRELGVGLAGEGSQVYAVQNFGSRFP
jgi:uncharacterized protein YkwD